MPAAGPDDDQLLHLLHGTEKVGRGALQGVQRRLGVRGVGSGALIPAVSHALDEAEIRDIARDRRLRGVEAALPEAPAQLLLALDRVLVDQREQHGLSARFHDPK
jgi:hypothetical protein